MYLSSIDNTDCLECDLNFYSFNGECIKSTKYTAELEMITLMNLKIIALLLISLIN